MPKSLEDKLRKEAAKKGLVGRRANAYIYGSDIMRSYLQKERSNKKKRV